MKSVVVFFLIILSTGQVIAAIKDCEELKSEIAAKMVANGVSSFSLAIVDRNRTGSGKIIGRCQGGTKRIVRLPVARDVSEARQHDILSRSAVTFAYGVKDCEELKSAIAATMIDAGVSLFSLAIVDKDHTGTGKIVGSCKNGTKRIVHHPVALSGAGQGAGPSPLAVTPAYGIQDCEELKSEIAAKLVTAGISPSVLAIVDKERTGAAKIIGRCENGAKRIVRIPAGDSVLRAGQTNMAPLPSVTLAYGIKDCKELKSEIAAKMVANGVSSFSLAIVDKDRTGAGKILGRCENGTKRIIRLKDIVN